MTHLNTLLIELVTQEQGQETKEIVAKLSFSFTGIYHQKAFDKRETNSDGIKHIASIQTIKYYSIRFIKMEQQIDLF